MDREESIKRHANSLERVSWFLVVVGMLTEVSSEYAFPSYNVALGFWGAYSSFSKHGRATFGFISFTFLSILLDVVFCAINSHRASVFEFCLTMFIICMLLKVYALYQSSLFFTSIGGAYSLESSKLTTSMYESLRTSQHSASSLEENEQAGYYPPEDDGGHAATTSFLSKSALVDSGTF